MNHGAVGIKVYFDIIPIRLKHPHVGEAHKPAPVSIFHKYLIVQVQLFVGLARSYGFVFFLFNDL